MIYVSVNDAFIEKVQEDLLVSAAQAALDQQDIKNEVDLGIVVEDSAHLHELNREYREIDAPTDVLSFALNENDPETGRLYLGDVIISFPQAAEQAARGGHEVMAELQLLTVHGVLHLLGHDHAESAEKAAMWAAQRTILDSLHVKISIWPEE